MRKYKKALSILLALLLTVPVFSLSFSAEAATRNVPILRIHGERNVYYVGEDGQKYSLFEDGEYVQAIVDKALPYALTALVTGDWSKWSEVAFAELKPALDRFAPDEEGNVPADTVCEGRFEPSAYGVKDTADVANSYEVWPDMRKSPMDEADYLKEVIDAIKQKTGHNKIKLVSQCMGAEYLMAYLQKYEEPRAFSGVESVLLTTSTSNGIIANDMLFSGNAEFTLDGSYHSLGKYEFPEEAYGIAGGKLMELLFDTLDVLYRSKFSGKMTVGFVQRVYDQIKDSFIKDVIQEYYGRCGGYVGSVVDRYEEYKDYVFPTREEKDRFAVLLAKSDDYYYNVQQRQPEIIKGMQDLGINVGCIAEYGVQYTNVVAGDAAMETSDNRVAASRASFGATAADMGETLPDDLIAAREAAGLGKYVSPDRQIDASTGLMPDSTWFIKNAPHNFDPSVCRLATAILAAEHGTVKEVWEAAGFTQFLWYTGYDTDLIPLTADMTDDANVAKPASKNYITAVIEWIKTFFKLIGELLKSRF